MVIKSPRKRAKEKNKNYKNNQKNNEQMEINTQSSITINVNRVNAATIKVAKWMQNKTHVSSKDTHRLKVKRIKKHTSCQWK